MKRIHLTNYRNYEDTIFPLSQHTVFIGPNGIGKTNVLEAIRTFSVTKAYRVRQDSDTIRWQSPYCRLELNYDESLLEYVLTKEETGSKKIFKHNGVIIPLRQVYGLVPTVLFSPETLQLIEGSPQERRRFLDTILSQADQQYIESLLTYRKVLRERHFVLIRLKEGLGQEDELNFWDHELARSGNYIIGEREKFLTTINRYLETIYPKFLAKNQHESLVLQYKPSCKKEELEKKLTSNRLYDIKTTTTQSGPHRDEIVFLLNGLDIISFASRGELRRAVLAVKFAEAQYLRDVRNLVPTLLLDDVFSELDILRRELVTETLASYATIITTTEGSFISPVNSGDTIIHELPQKSPKKQTKKQ